MEQNANQSTVDKVWAEAAEIRSRKSFKSRDERVNGDEESTGKQKSGGQKPKRVSERGSEVC